MMLMLFGISCLTVLVFIFLFIYYDTNKIIIAGVIGGYIAIFLYVIDDSIIINESRQQWLLSISFIMFLFLIFQRNNNVITKEWIKLAKYPNDTTNLSHFIQINNIEFVQNMHKYNIKTDEWKCSKYADNFTNHQPVTAEFDPEDIRSAGFIQLKSCNTLLLLGGYDTNIFYKLTFHDKDTMYSYNIHEKKWKLLPQKLPVELSSFGCALSINEKFVVIFGGTTGTNYNNGIGKPIKMDAIYVLNTQTMKFKKSNIKCPNKANYTAITMDQKISKSELVTFGKQSIFSDVSFPPNELMEIIASYTYYREYIYLLSEHGEHWKIKLNDIIQNC